MITETHTSAMSVVKWTDAEGVERRVATCSHHVPALLREHLHQGPAILPAQRVEGRRARCGQSVPIEYELVIARRADYSTDRYDVYQVRVLEFGDHVGEYDTVENFEVTIGLAVDPELPDLHPRTLAFANAVDTAVRILDGRGYTLTQQVTYKGGYADGRVSK